VWHRLRCVLGMSARQKAHRMASDLGVELEQNITKDRYDIQAWAPTGKRFSGSGGHVRCESCNRGPWGYDGLWDALTELLELGLEECPADCGCQENSS
jgi:hypothetical protein